MTARLASNQPYFLETQQSSAIDEAHILLVRPFLCSPQISVDMLGPRDTRRLLARVTDSDCRKIRSCPTEDVGRTLENYNLPTQQVDS